MKKRKEVKNMSEKLRSLIMWTLIVLGYYVLSLKAPNWVTISTGAILLAILDLNWRLKG